MIDSVGATLDLQELGTRYDHYMEMKEVFMLGIDVINNMRPMYVNDADKALRNKLIITVEVINRRIDYLSNFAAETSDYSDLAREVQEAGKHVTSSLTEGSNVKPQDSNQASDPKNSGAPSDLS